MDTGSIEPCVDAFEVFGCGWERITCTPGYSLDQGGLVCRSKVTLPTSQGSMTPVTMLEISQGSGASSPRLRVLRFRRPFQVRLVREACLATLGTCQLCARSKRRSGSPSATRREAESKRRETVQVEGRHPYLVTGAAVLGVGGGVPLRLPFTPTSREIKVSGANLRALAPRGGYADEFHTCDNFGCAVRLLSMTVGRPTDCRRESFGAPALMRLC